MSDLAGTQREFLAAIVAGGEASDAGLEVYRANLLGVRHDALAAAYPVVRRLVGEAFFREAAERFARATPSTSGDLHAYGADFPRFMAAYPYALALAYLPDVARLEWAVHEAQHAADGAPFDFAALGRVPPDSLGGLRIRLHPAVRLVHSSHPILAIWEANQAGRDGAPCGEAGPDRVLVRREGHAVAPIAVGAVEWELLRALADGATLDAATAALADDRSLSHALARLGALGALGGFDCASAP